MDHRTQATNRNGQESPSSVSGQKAHSTPIGKLICMSGKVVFLQTGEVSKSSHMFVQHWKKRRKLFFVNVDQWRIGSYKWILSRHLKTHGKETGKDQMVHDVSGIPELEELSLER